MEDLSKEIQKDIEKAVAHLSRVHNVGHKRIWSEMYIKSLEYLSIKD